MGFNIFMFSLHGDDARPFPFSIVTDVWGQYLNGKEPWTALSFPNGEECYVTISGPNGPPERDGVHHIGIERPPASPEFWQGLFEIMCLTRSFLVWAGGGPVATDEAAIQFLPANYRMADATPKIARTWEDIGRYIPES